MDAKDRQPVDPVVGDPVRQDHDQIWILKEFCPLLRARDTGKKTTTFYGFGGPESSTPQICNSIHRRSSLPSQSLWNFKKEFNTFHVICKVHARKAPLANTSGQQPHWTQAARFYQNIRSTNLLAISTSIVLMLIAQLALHLKMLLLVQWSSAAWIVFLKQWKQRSGYK